VTRQISFKNMGPRMIAAYNFIAAHDGCSKLAAAQHCWGRIKGVTNFGYRPVNRLIKMGAVIAEWRGNRYALHAVEIA
jgi:hypothetical protein